MLIVIVECELRLRRIGNGYVRKGSVTELCVWVLIVVLFLA